MASRTGVTATTRFETEALRDAFTKIGMEGGWNNQLDKLEDLTVDTTGRDLSSSRLPVDRAGLQRYVKLGSDIKTFFAQAPTMNPNTSLIKGVWCAVFAWRTSTTR